MAFPFLVFVLAAFLLFWNIRDFSPMEGSAAWYAYAVSVLLDSFHGGGSFAAALNTAWSGIFYGPPPPKPAELTAFLNIPLTTLWLMVCYAVLGVNSFAFIAGSASIGLVNVMVIHAIGTKLLGKWGGFVSAILLSFSLILLLSSRAGFSWQILAALFTALTLYSLYRAVNEGGSMYYWLGGTFFGLGMFNGYPTAMLSPMIVFVWLLWQKRGFGFLKEKGLWIAAFWSIALFVLLSAAYSLAFDLGGLLDAVKSIGGFIGDRGGKETAPFKDWRFLYMNPLMAFQSLFVGMPRYGIPYGPSMPNLTVPGIPMIPLPIAIFLLAGIILAARRRTSLDRFLLSWLGITVGVFTLLATFEGRYIIVALPALYMLAATGMLTFVSVARRRDAAKPGRSAEFVTLAGRAVGPREISALAVVSAAILYSGIATYSAYFTQYVSNDAYLWRSIGDEEVARFITAADPGGESLVVLGHKVLVPDNGMIFYTRGKYTLARWYDIVATEKENIINLQQWERQVLRAGKKSLFFVFSLDNAGIRLPGKPESYGNDYEDLAFFKRLHPGLRPSRIIHTSKNVPVFAIYEVKEAPYSVYDCAIGTPGHRVCAQTFRADHPVLDRILFKAGYKGRRELLPDMIIELARIDEHSPPEDALASAKVLVSKRIHRDDLALSGGEYSNVSLGFAGMMPGHMYAVIWRQAREGAGNYYVLARQRSDIYADGVSATFDGSRWSFQRNDIDFVPVRADYTFESIARNGTYTFEIPENSEEQTVSFKIVLDRDTWENRIYEMRNIEYRGEGDGEFRWLQPVGDAGGYLVYRVRASRRIKTISLRTEPRISNDSERKNSIKLSYSVDARKFREVYELRSTGRVGMTGIYERPMQNTIQPDNKEVYLRFDLSSSGSQLWATRTHPMVFTVTVAAP